MKQRRRAGVLALVLVLLVVSASGAAADDLTAQAEKDVIAILGETHTPSGLIEAPVTAPPSTVITHCVPMEETGQLRCYSTDTEGSVLDGIQATTVEPGGAPTAQEIAAAAATELRRLPLRSGGITIQPPNGTTLVNVETIVMTDPSPQAFDVTILGTPVTVTARPARYQWAFGDDTPPLTTTEPGAPWPNHTVAHVYRSTGTRTIALSTEWTGTYRVGDDTTEHPIAGTATTIETAPPLRVEQAVNRLVTQP